MQKATTRSKRLVYSLVDVRTDLLKVQLVVGPAHERLFIRHIEEVHAHVQVHRWLRPEIVDLAAFLEF